MNSTRLTEDGNEADPQAAGDRIEELDLASLRRRQYQPFQLLVFHDNVLVLSLGLEVRSCRGSERER